MNRDFLSNFERPVEQKPKNSDEVVPVSENLEYHNNEFAQNVCFIWPEGNRHFIEYSRLDSGKINLEESMIRLMFGAETVELSGIRLLPLFDSLMHHKRKYIYCDDERYNELISDGPIVNEIIINV